MNEEIRPTALTLRDGLNIVCEINTDQLHSKTEWGKRGNAVPVGVLIILNKKGDKNNI